MAGTRLTEREAAAEALRAPLQEVLKSIPHETALDALFNTYFELAVAHSCCTQGAANVCMQAAITLARIAAERRAIPQAMSATNQVH